MISSYEEAVQIAFKYNRLKELVGKIYFSGRMSQKGYQRLVKHCNERIVECLPILLHERNVK